MKPIIFLNLLLLSTTLYANTKHCDAVYTRGHIDLTTPDIIVQEGTQAQVPIVFDMEFYNPDYKSYDMFDVLINNDVEGAQVQIKWDRYVTYTLFHEHVSFNSKVNKNLSKGNHVFLFEVNVPRYGCQVIASSIITVV